MVVLHWIKGNGQYKQFVANSGAKKYNCTKRSSGDMYPPMKIPRTLRVGVVLFNPRYSGGQDKSGSKIHDNTVTQSSPAAEQEANVIREVLRMAQATPTTSTSSLSTQACNKPYGSAHVSRDFSTIARIKPRNAAL